MKHSRAAVKSEAAKPVLAIISTTSGRHLPHPRSVERAFVRHGFWYVRELVKHPDDAVAALKTYDLSNYQAVAVFSGDSTAAAVMKALADTAVPIIILPGGSANLLAKEFGIPSNIDAILRAYAKNKYVLRHVPLAEANGKPFIFDLHFGLFSVAVNTTSKHLKRLFGQQAYRISAFKAAPRARKYHFQFVIDGKTIKKRGYACFVLAGSGPWLLGRRVGPRPKAERLRVVLIKNIHPWTAISWAAARLFTGRELPTVTKSWHGKEIDILKAPSNMNFDDQPTKADFPLRIRVGKQVSQVVVPTRGKRNAYYTRRWLRINYYRYSARFLRLLSGVPYERYSRISDRLYLGGQYRSRALRRFQKQNITGIINMRSGAGSRQLPPDIDVLHLSTRDHHAPRLKYLESGVAFIQRHVKKDGAVYIHCNLGEGRGPTMAAAYLVATGMRPQDAIAHLQQYRPFAKPNKKQRRCLEQFAATLSKPQER